MAQHGAPVRFFHQLRQDQQRHSGQGPPPERQLQRLHGLHGSLSYNKVARPEEGGKNQVNGGSHPANLHVPMFRPRRNSGTRLDRVLTLAYSLY
ncbi:hypothetical protein GCM10011577_14100 [Pseudarthrobacter polychromogenes]|uniref:Uncharacterized protein n=1 Tax=Pseudarthrobacter polychromogenes TaxID=1676 RepID=A0ABQ1XEY9_9MICC|nr:hypothetical protein GCM10011577_14100 [Pseudarthrobacter polychromogenes]